MDEIDTMINKGAKINRVLDYAFKYASESDKEVIFKFNTITWIVMPDGSYERWNKNGLIGRFSERL